MLSRRQFVQSSLCASGMVAWGVSAPRFLQRTALAAPDSTQAGAKDTVLVVVQLTGGNDGLNTVVPYADDGYGRVRKTLRLPTDSLLKLDDKLGLHPSLSGFKSLLDDGALSIVQGVGYPNPNESHFRSMDIWQGGTLADEISEGWLGKTLGQLATPTAFHVAADNETAGLALAGAPAKAPSLRSLEDFQLHLLASSGADRAAQNRLLEQTALRPPSNSNDGPAAGLLDFVRRTAVNTHANSRRLQELSKDYQPKSPYPTTGLAQRLKLAAQLIEADVGARVFYVTLDGFDTHASQLDIHARLLRELSDGVTAFFKDLAARGHRDRVLLMTFSEFGRRAKENDSAGTDHGSAAPMFLVGGRVKAGVVGAHPSLSDLTMDKLKHHTDFRQVYAGVLESWLGVSGEKVLGEKFKPVEVLKTA